MNINYFLKYSKANGPGTRFVLWVQGCGNHCPGCRNTDTHSFEPNILISEEDIIKIIPNNVDGLTITGGEPFDQSKSILKLSKLFKEKYPNKNIFVFTGYTIYELETKNLIEESKKYIDILLTGRFIEEMQDNESWKRWAGSSNQVIVFLNDKIDKTISNKTRAEVIIGKETIISGFPTLDDTKKYFNVKII